MRQRIGPGAEIDFLTPDELVHMFPRAEQETRIRETGQLQLDSTGGGTLKAYEVPAGYEFEARRVTLYQGLPSDGVTGAVALNVAGHSVVYQRSGALIELGQPQYGAAYQVPGIQTWGAEQGPYLRNKEVFEVKALGLTANAMLTVVTEGILTRPQAAPKAA